MGANATIAASDDWEFIEQMRLARCLFSPWILPC
jgi:hypothetical protein